MSLTTASVEFLLNSSTQKSPRGFGLVWFNLSQFWSCLYETFSSCLQSLPLLPFSSGRAQMWRTFAFVFLGCILCVRGVLQRGRLILPLALAVSLNSSLLSATKRFVFLWFPGAWCALCSSEGLWTSVKVTVSSYLKLEKTAEDPVTGHYPKLAQALGAVEIRLPSKWTLLHVAGFLLHFSWICEAFLAT